MKKPHNYQERSDTVCIEPGCERTIKANVASRKPEGTPIRCFRCNQATQRNTNNPIRTAREIRVNPGLRSHKRWDKAIPLGRA